MEIQVTVESASLLISCDLLQCQKNDQAKENVKKYIKENSEKYCNRHIVFENLLNAIFVFVMACNWRKLSCYYLQNWQFLNTIILFHKFCLHLRLGSTSINILNRNVILCLSSITYQVPSGIMMLTRILSMSKKGAQGYSSHPTKPESPNYINVEKRLTKLCL